MERKRHSTEFSSSSSNACHQHCKSGFNTLKKARLSQKKDLLKLLLKWLNTYSVVFTCHLSLKMLLQGPDPSLAYRPDLDINKTKEKDDYRNFEVSIQSSSLDIDTYRRNSERVTDRLTGPLVSANERMKERILTLHLVDSEKRFSKKQCILGCDL